MPQPKQRIPETKPLPLADNQLTGGLACIMFTDIVGYTTMIEHDEKLALQILDQNRDIQRSLIELHDGKWIKEMGDGILATFRSAGDAVKCAQAIQHKTKSINTFQLRIGVHLGKVIFSNNDVFGLAVNIASRLQELAHPAQILISEAVARNLKTVNNLNSQLIGLKKLKHVKDPVKTYGIGNGQGQFASRYSGSPAITRFRSQSINLLLQLLNVCKLPLSV